LLNETEIPEWIVRTGFSVRCLAWFGSTVIVLCAGKTRGQIDVISFSISDQGKLMYTIPLQAKPHSLSVSGNRLLVGYSNRFSLHSLDNGGKLVGTRDLGEISTKRIAFLNTKSVAVHTFDRRLLLVFRSTVRHIFGEVLGFQLTGSTAWPMVVFGIRWRVLGANNAELFLDFEMCNGLFLGENSGALRLPTDGTARLQSSCAI
jgi:hypothetical protein